jgi:hypothetical protein
MSVRIETESLSAFNRNIQYGPYDLLSIVGLHLNPGIELHSGLYFGSARNQKLIPTGVGDIFQSAFKVGIVIDANDRA